MLSADEGEFDFTGGRGWSIRSRNGKLVWEDGGALERAAVKAGQYPDGRSDAKGIESTRRPGDTEFAFVGSERGSFLAVDKLRKGGAKPKLVQLLPTRVSPEGILSLPERGLVVTSSEGTGDLPIFTGVPYLYRGTEDRPEVRSKRIRTPWSAVSGLAGDTRSARTLWGVPDNALLIADSRRRDVGASVTPHRAVRPRAGTWTSSSTRSTAGGEASGPLRDRQRRRDRFLVIERDSRSAARPRSRRSTSSRSTVSSHDGSPCRGHHAEDAAGKVIEKTLYQEVVEEFGPSRSSRGSRSRARRRLGQRRQRRRRARVALPASRPAARHPPSTGRGYKIGIIGATTPNLPFITTTRHVMVDIDVVGAVSVRSTL